MTVNEKLYRLVQFASDMYIEYKVPTLPPPMPTGAEVVDMIMKKSKVDKLDIDVQAYKKLVKRADKKLLTLKDTTKI